MKRNYVHGIILPLFRLFYFSLAFPPRLSGRQARWLNWRRRRRKEGDGCEISRLRGIMSGKFIAPFFSFPRKFTLPACLHFPKEKRVVYSLLFFFPFLPLWIFSLSFLGMFVFTLLHSLPSSLLSPHFQILLRPPPCITSMLSPPPPVFPTRHCSK